jgi:hypothetical protein
VLVVVRHKHAPVRHEEGRRHSLVEGQVAVFGLQGSQGHFFPKFAVVAEEVATEGNCVLGRYALKFLLSDRDDVGVHYVLAEKSSIWLLVD